MCRSRSRISRSHWRFLRVFPQQSVGFHRVFLLQDQRDAPVKLSPRVAGRHALSRDRDRQQPLRLAALHGVIPDVVDQPRRFRIALQRFRKFLVRHGEVFLLPPAISSRVMPFGGVHLRQLLDLRQRFLFAASHDARSAAIELNQRLPRRKILSVELYGRLEFLARLFRQ